MIRIQPDFYGEFHCTASRCEDSCCVGWEIDVDEESLARYDAVSGSLEEKLRACIARGDEGAHFVLDGRERCPFLDENNLCEIYRELGEDALCDICREHPRFYEWFGDRVEAGLGLCCPEACRMLLQSEDHLRFIRVETGDPDEAFAGSPALLTALEPLRERVYALLQDNTRPFFNRLSRVLTELAAAQDALDGFPPAAEGISAPEPTDEELIALCGALEPIDEGWLRLTERLRRQCATALAPDWVYERAAVYLTYRWLLKAAFDGDALGKGRLIAAFLYLLRLLLARGAVGMPADALRILSKEIEYSQANTEYLQSWTWGGF